MDAVNNVSIGIAFIAGFLSFVSPCVLPLIPAYISYLTGRVTMQASMELSAVGPTLGTASVVKANRIGLLAHGLFFVGGFTLVFVSIGLLANASLRLLGTVFYDLQNSVAVIGGVLIIFFGLHVMGVTGWTLRTLATRIGWHRLGRPGEAILKFLEWFEALLYGDTRWQVNPRNPYGYGGSALLGIVFAAGWTPCVGPIYGSILTVAANTTAGSTLGKAGILLFSYSMGLGIPFLAASVAVDQFRKAIKRIQRYMRAIEIVSGIFLITIGYLLATRQFAYLSQYSTGLLSFSTDLESCTVGIIRGEIPGSDFGTCMKLGPDYKQLTPDGKPKPTPITIFSILPDGRAVYIRE